MKQAHLTLALGLAIAAGGVASAATVPDLTGMYVKEQRAEGAPRDGGGNANAPFTPEYRAQRAREQAVIASAKLLTGQAHTRCLPPGMPGMMQPPFGVEFLQTAGRITIIAEVSNLPRTIYLNEKTHPENLDPGWNGHSIGHWEKGVLLVDTVGFNGRTSGVSAKMHMTEKIYLTDGGKTLVDEITMDDPETYTRPHTITYRYTRRPADEELMEYFCEVLPESLNALEEAEKAAANPAKQAAN